MPKRPLPKRKTSLNNRRQRNLHVSRKRRPSASHLLIIECEPAKLAAQQLDFGSNIHALFQNLFSNKKIVLVRASSKDELCRALGETMRSHHRFRTILIVGHSNDQGLQLTPDDFYEWSAVGYWLTPFEPEFLLVAACSAGRSAGIRQLFEQVTTLREIYASPVTLFRDQTEPFVLLLGAVLKNRKIDEGLLRGVQAAGYLFRDAVIYRFKRKETRRGKELKGFVWDVFGQLLNRRAYR
jgi:hypothetical protein